MSYIEKVGVSNGEAIRLDRRQRQDKNGWWSERLPETWEEAHAVVIEREAVSAGSRILKEHWSYIDEQAFPKSAQQGGLEQKGPGQHANKKSESACYNMRDKGECKFGDRCQFSHDPRVLAKSKKDGQQDKRGKFLCKFILDPNLGDCPKGVKCPYSHDPSTGKKKNIQRDAAGSSRQDDELSDGGWDSPVGLGHGCGGIYSVVVSDAEYDKASKALESRVLDRPGLRRSSGPQHSGWRAGPIAISEVANRDRDIKALKAEVAQLKDTLATLMSVAGGVIVAQPEYELATTALPPQGNVDGSGSDASMSLHREWLQKRDVRKSLHREWLRQKCTAKSGAGIVKSREVPEVPAAVSESPLPCEPGPVPAAGARPEVEETIVQPNELATVLVTLPREPGLLPAAGADGKVEETIIPPRNSCTTEKRVGNSVIDSQTQSVL
jgi:hypothetical protein